MNLDILNNEIISCKKCDRLVEFREKVAREKRKSFLEWNYWGNPVPGYGDRNSSLLIIGLAPAAHGGNRTGRVFTGDKSADFLFKCLHHTGLSNQPNSDSRDDGLRLKAYMTVSLKCVPPGDKPRPDEKKNCSKLLSRELELLPNLKIILGLGKIGYDSYLRFISNSHPIKMKDYSFKHGKGYDLPNGNRLYGCYHPSPRNVNTKRLTFNMMVDFLDLLKKEL